MKRVKELYSRIQPLLTFALMLSMFICFTACEAAGPKPPIELPFAVHKAGATVSTELRIPKRGPFVYYFVLKFMHKKGDYADRERVRSILGSWSINKITGKPVNPGIQIPLKIALSVIDSSGEHIFMEKEVSTEGIDAHGVNYFIRQIDLHEVSGSPGLYRVSVRCLKDIPELKDVKVFFAIYYPREG